MNCMKMKKFSVGRPKSNNHGFTLVELMIALVVSGIVLAALYAAYTAQQRHAIAQEQVADMQQNLRAGMNFLVREIRMVGFDPQGTNKFGFVAIEEDALVFTADFNEDGDVGGTGQTECFGYDTYLSGSTGLWTLGRKTSTTDNIAVTHIGGGHYEIASSQPLAENIEQLEFVYLLDNDDVTTDPERVSFLQISMLAKANRSDPEFTNNKTYYPASNPDSLTTGTKWGPYGDNYRRRLMITSVKLRNMGLVNE